MRGRSIRWLGSLSSKCNRRFPNGGRIVLGLGREFLNCCFWAMTLALLSVQGLSAQESNGAARLMQVVKDNPDNRAARWALAQVAFRAGQYNAARYHLEVLLSKLSSQSDIDTLTRALAEVTAADPWDVTLSFALLPSTNINRTTYNTEFETMLGKFTPAGGGNQESGIGLTLGAGLSYALSLSDNSRLTLRTRVDQHLYRSSYLNQTTLLFAVRRDSFAVGRSTAFEPYVRLRYDENQSLDRRDVGLRFSTDLQLERVAHLTATALLEDRGYSDSNTSDGPYGRLSIRYSFAADEKTRLGFGFAVARSNPKSGHLKYWAAQVFADATHRFQDIGTFGVFGRYSQRNYDELFPATALIRSDDKFVLGLSFMPSSFELFGTRPRASCQVERTFSNIALYDYKSTDCGLTFERKF
jgi:hypothetical protein